jgi:hypothetical protein
LITFLALIILTAVCHEKTFAQVLPNSGGGLRGDYFGNEFFSDIKVSRTDAAVDFDWGLGSPHPLVRENYYSVRWTGYVQPKFSELYTFYLYGDDQHRLWINGQLVVNVGWAGDPQEHSWTSTYLFEAGRKYDIKVEYYEGGWTSQMN